jgi:cytochrome bd-type quinol oxidase subunit 2
MGAGAAGVFPVMLHSTLAPQDSISAYAAATDPYSLRLALTWWPFAVVLSLGYFWFVFRHYRPRVR